MMIANFKEELGGDSDARSSYCFQEDFKYNNLMKKIISVLLTLMLVLPAFAPLLSHEAVHVFQDSHASAHHNANHHGHHHHENKDQHQVFAQYALPLDIVTYFKDYLHVDLKKPEQLNLNLDASSEQNLDQALAFVTYPILYQALNFNSRAPPDQIRLWIDSLPVYLSTQRLRI